MSAQVRPSAVLGSPRRRRHRSGRGPRSSRGLQGLGKVIVSAEFQTDDPIRLLAHSREHDHRGAVVEPDSRRQICRPSSPGSMTSSTTRSAGAAGQGAVEARAVAGRLDLEPVPAEESRTQVRVCLDRRPPRQCGGWFASRRRRLSSTRVPCVGSWPLQSMAQECPQLKQLCASCRATTDFASFGVRPRRFPAPCRRRRDWSSAPAPKVDIGP